MSETTAGDELRAEYQFDYARAKPNRFAGAAKKRPAPPDTVQAARGGGTTSDENIRKLREAATAFAHDRELGEAKVRQYTPVLQQLRVAKMLTERHTIIGPVLHSTADDNTQSAVYYAAGIGDAGIGAYRYHLAFDEAPDALTAYDFIPYDECPPLVQAGLAGQIDGLVIRLMGDLGVPAA